MDCSQLDLANVRLKADEASRAVGDGSTEKLGTFEHIGPGQHQIDRARRSHTHLSFLPLAGDFSNMPLQESGGCSKTLSHVQGPRNVYRMDATFAFLSYLKLLARGYAKSPFSG